VSTTTPKLGLTKPAGTEKALVSVLNNNSDLIDQFAISSDAKFTSRGVTGLVPNAASGAERNALYPTPVNGDRVWRTDINTMEYFNGVGWRLTQPNAIRPSSITGGTQQPDGMITFGASAAVSVLGCFSNQFSAYTVIIDVDTVTLGARFGLRLLTGSSPLVTNTYLNAGTGVHSDIAVSGNHGLGTNVRLQTANSPEGVSQLSATVTILRPALAQRTRFLVNAFGANGAAQADSYQGGALQTDSTAYDGLQLMNSGVTMSGSIRVFGIQGA
jgi:hypothetical protein